MPCPDRVSAPLAWSGEVLTMTRTLTLALALLLTACGAHVRPLERAPALDGSHRELATCDDVAARASAPADAYDACLSALGY
jgi:hypothetical protein